MRRTNWPSFLPYSVVSISVYVYCLLCCGLSILFLVNDSYSFLAQVFFPPVGDEISDIAVDLCTSLVQTFSEIYDIQANNPNLEQPIQTPLDNPLDDGDFTKSLVAMGILNSILSLLTAMSSNLPLLAQLEQSITELLVYLLKTGLLDLYEEVFQIIERLTDDQISNGMWQMLFLIYESFQRDAFDYFPSIMPTLYNYVSVDETTFLSSPRHVDCVIDMCTSVLDRCEEECTQLYACKMLEIMLLNLKGS